MDREIQVNWNWINSTSGWADGKYVFIDGQCVASNFDESDCDDDVEE